MTGTAHPLTVTAPASVSAGAELERDPTEALLLRIWSEALQEDVAPTAALLGDLDASSLACVEALIAIEREFAISRPLQWILEFETVRAQAIHIQLAKAGKLSAVATSARWPMEVRAGVGAPIFIFAPLPGTFVVYNLIALLKTARPIYYFGVDVEYDSVYQLAAVCVGAMRALQPEGPYYLGGTSFGGIVAFEAACQLEAQGHPSRVFMVDSWPPGASNALILKVRGWLDHVLWRYPRTVRFLRRYLGRDAFAEQLEFGLQLIGPMRTAANDCEVDRFRTFASVFNGIDVGVVPGDTVASMWRRYYSLLLPTMSDRLYRLLLAIFGSDPKALAPDDVAQRLRIVSHNFDLLLGYRPRRRLTQPVTYVAGPRSVEPWRRWCTDLTVARVPTERSGADGHFDVMNIQSTRRWIDAVAAAMECG